MVLAIPASAWALATAVASEAGFALVASRVSSGLFKFALVLLLWSFLHHLFAGLRYLLMDLGYAVNLPPARLTAFLALCAGLVATLVIAGVLL